MEQAGKFTLYCMASRMRLFFGLQTFGARLSLALSLPILCCVTYCELEELKSVYTNSVMPAQIRKTQKPELNVTSPLPLPTPIRLRLVCL
jgi:hypothetical protein